MPSMCKIYIAFKAMWLAGMFRFGIVPAFLRIVLNPIVVVVYFVLFCLF